MSARTKFLLKFVGAILGLYLILALKPVDEHVVVPFTRLVTATAVQILVLFGYVVEARGTFITSGNTSTRSNVAVWQGIIFLMIILFLVGWNWRLAAAARNR